ncbi:MAG: hypothetical protein IKA76_05035 [Clostridia bacterium]|nr:hypothetical protein [Clostridia bacterium]
MRNSSKDNLPRGLKPVQRIELSEKNKKVRIVLLIVFAVIALGAFGFAIFSSLHTEDGWYSIQVQSAEDHCGDDFIFNYYVADSEVSAKTQYDRITALYSEAAVKAYRMFHAEEAFADVNNLYSINTHAGETLVVDEILYRAFELLEQKGSRYLYFGPLYEEYALRFFGYGQAAIAENDDPYVNTELAAYFAELAAFANDPASVQLELLGENRVRLLVSEEYAEFAEENGFDRFLDFFRIKNAFVVDFLAETMLENGYSYGAISSYDGYTRTLDQKHVYAYTLFDRRDQVVSAIATLSYQNGGSLVYLRNYPMSEQESFFYYASERLTIPPMFNPANGLYQTATNGMIGYSKTLGCAETVLDLMPLYTAEEVDVVEMLALNGREIATVWCEDHCVCYTDQAFSPKLLITDGEYAYESVFVTEDR